MQNLERIRRLRGLSQRGLANKAGVVETTVTGIERGHHNPRPVTARKLAAALDVDIQDLYGEAIPKADAPSKSGREERVATVTSLEDFNLLNLIGEFQGRLSHDPDARPEIPGLEVTDLRSAELFFQKALEEIREKQRGRSA